MHQSRLFWKLFLTCAGLTLVAVVVVAAILSDHLQDRIIDQVDRRLRDSAHLLQGELAEQMQSGPSQALQTRLRRMGQETETRFTLIALNGTVLADSERATLADVEAMDNHRDRPEVVQARTHGEGRSSRRSATLGERLRYYAVVVVVDGSRVGFVRSSLPLSVVRAEVGAARRTIWGITSVALLGLLAAWYWIIGVIIRPLKPLAAAAEAIAAGDYQQRVYVASRDELGTLARTFNRMSQELEARTKLLHQSGDRQSTVLDGMIEGVIAVDDRQRVVLANPAAGRLFEFRPLVAAGRPLLEVVRNHALHEAVTAALTTGAPRRLETRREGTEKLRVDIHVQPLPGSPCPGVVLVMHDTTELRRLESLRRDFIANVSHELKTPLSSIKAYAETLRNGAMHDPETSHKFLERIEEQTDRLNHLIMDMLMLARIESDQQAFEIVAVDVAEVVASCLNDYRRAADAKRITLASEPAQQPCRVQADREGLREILDNLIDNAIKYTPEGGSVTVSWSEVSGVRFQVSETTDTRHLTPDTFLCISVRDTGIGIKPQDQERVFERFYRVDKARSRELGGTGLGLAIVKHLTQSFGGKVAVESEPGFGSTFTVELPRG